MNRQAQCLKSWSIARVFDHRLLRALFTALCLARVAALVRCEDALTRSMLDEAIPQHGSVKATVVSDINEILIAD